MSAIRSHTNPALPKLNLPADIPHASTAYLIMRAILQALFSVIYKLRTFNRHLEPASGGVLYICNHQSFLDPIIASCMLQRPCNYMARDSLFRNAFFAKVISTFNAFPVKRGTADTGAIKEAMRRLKAGGCLVIFAEGTRTEDGRIGPMLPGVALLAQRAAKWVVPVVIDGAYEAWPRTRKFPGAGSMMVQYGTPMPQEQAKKLSSDELIATMRQQMIAMQTDLRKRAGRPELKYDRN
ncbi:MAG: 1-acyl-sn-glycerol-3-phosphate acyltransferase [Planctomycetaceae bacterium]|nr:1-acyl-sn-glycerol-3-phosphate acyltransferase [Planctomycetaceae bacterium]